MLLLVLVLLMMMIGFLFTTAAFIACSSRVRALKDGCLGFVLYGLFLFWGGFVCFEFLILSLGGVVFVYFWSVLRFFWSSSLSFGTSIRDVIGVYLYLFGGVFNFV